MNHFEELGIGGIEVDVLSRLSSDILNAEELKTKLEKGKKLRIKYGVDVTAPFMHLGHAVNLWSYCQIWCMA